MTIRSLMYGKRGCLYQVIGGPTKQLQHLGARANRGSPSQRASCIEKRVPGQMQTVGVYAAWANMAMGIPVTLQLPRHGLQT